MPTPSGPGRPGDLGPLEQTLGWASIALGVPQTLSPGRFARAVGAPDGPRARAIVLALCGPRELGVGAAILAGERPWPTRALWARVAGDALDMGLLVAAFRNGPRSRVRLGLAVVGATAIGTADLLAAVRGGEQADGDTDLPVVKEHPKRERTGVTIRRPLEEVRERWAAWDGEAPTEAASFEIAPGGRGTEVRVDLTTGGQNAVVDAARSVAGLGYGQRVADDLRHFKQTVETGEVLRSDGSPEGPRGPRLLTQRPAQPLQARPENA